RVEAVDLVETTGPGVAVGCQVALPASRSGHCLSLLELRGTGPKLRLQLLSRGDVGGDDDDAGDRAAGVAKRRYGAEVGAELVTDYSGLLHRHRLSALHNRPVVLADRLGGRREQGGSGLADQ